MCRSIIFVVTIWVLYNITPNLYSFAQATTFNGQNLLHFKNSEDNAQCDLKLLAWNIYMLPAHTFMPIGQKKRAKHIAQPLLDGQYDVVVFSEAFHRVARKKIWQQLKNTFPYQAGPLNKGGFLKTNGGVWIVSRYPLRFLGEVKFEDCIGMDCWARKGAMAVEVEKNGLLFQIIGTHLQSDEDALRDSVRMKQYLTIRDKLLLPNQKTGIIQFVCGDLNTLPESATYQAMQQVLGANDGELGGELQLSWPTTDFCKPGQKTCFLFDYILAKPNGKKIAKIERQLRIFQETWQHKKHSRHDLSDHYGVEMRLWW